MSQFLEALSKAAPEEERRESPDKTEEDPRPVTQPVPNPEKTGSQKKGFWGFWKKKEKREKSFYLELKTDTGLTRSWKIQPDQWLTHYSPSLNRPEEYLDAARKIFPRVEVCRDGKTIELNFEDEVS